MIVTWCHFKTSSHERAFSTPIHHVQKGIMSGKAIQRIKTAVQWLTYLAKPKRIYMKKEDKHFTFKIGLLTLTLSSKQEHTDREIKRLLLQPFLRRMRQQYRVRNYIWKAEAQQNGNIHFHLVIDKFIHYMDLRNTWNTIQEGQGYITRSGIENPNSTDVHSVKNVRNLAAYLCKYLAKNEKDKRLIEGKLWDCNEELKAIKVVERIEGKLLGEIEGMRYEKGKRKDGTEYTIRQEIDLQFASLLKLIEGDINKFPNVKSRVHKVLIDSYRDR